MGRGRGAGVAASSRTAKSRHKGYVAVGLRAGGRAPHNVLHVDPKHKLVAE